MRFVAVLMFFAVAAIVGCRCHDEKAAASPPAGVQASDGEQLAIWPFRRRRGGGGGRGGCSGGCDSAAPACNVA